MGNLAVTGQGRGWISEGRKLLCSGAAELSVACSVFGASRPRFGSKPCGLGHNWGSDSFLVPA